jgi:hypothetical protein
MSWIRTLNLAGYKRVLDRKELRPLTYRTGAYKTKERNGASARRYYINYAPSDLLPEPPKARRPTKCVNNDGNQSHARGLCKRCYSRFWFQSHEELRKRRAAKSKLRRDKKRAERTQLQEAA